jgi:hypothetical protein
LTRKGSKVGSSTLSYLDTVYGSGANFVSPAITELQLQYQNFKNTLQQLAQKIGDIEQETEEHKYVTTVTSPPPSSEYHTFGECGC